MQYLTAIVRDTPLSIHFSLHNPDTAPGPVYVPVMLEPVGAFVTVEVRDGDEVVYRTHRPKFTPKLRPDRDGSYLALEPGYSYGVVLELDDCELAPGAYRVAVSYDNGDYQGSPGRPVGGLSFATTLALTVE